MERKIKFILLLIGFLGGLIIWRLYQLQIKNGEYYQVLALGQQISFEEIKGKRGEIFLKENLPLAQTKKKKILYVFPKKIKEIEKTSEILAEILGEKSEDLKKKIKKGEIFKKEISNEDFERLRRENLEGVSPDEILARFYPQKNFASDVIGFLNQNGQGQYGVEGYYDEVLTGEEGLVRKGKSPFGYLTLLLDSKFEKIEGRGAEIYLTLDYNIQYFAEKLLKEAKEKWAIDSGQIIVQQPSTGKILALADFPDFDPNHYFQVESLEIFLNSALQKLFEPGSVFKPITMAAGLEEKVITPETEYEDKGYVKLGGPPIYNFQKRVWGTQSMIDVLEESINTGAVFVEQKVGQERFLDYLEKFGFFEKTGIDLQGEEFSANESLKKGHPRDLAVASFGQGIEITPIQLVRAFGAIANGGELRRPYLVEKIVYPGEEELIIKPQNQGRVISEETSSLLTSMLVSVVENGSGRRAKIPGYFIAGKTGTAQVPLATGGYSKDKTIHSFMGYFPAFNPQFLIFIKLDNPKGVGVSAYTACPLFKKLAKYIIDLWQIPPSYQ